MHKYGLFLVSAALIAAPAAAQTYGGGYAGGGSYGTAGSPASYGATGSIGTFGSPRSFFLADGPTQLAAHKARWARIDAKRLQRAKEKAERAERAEKD